MVLSTHYPANSAIYKTPVFSLQAVVQGLAQPSLKALSSKALKWLLFNAVMPLNFVIALSKPMVDAHSSSLVILVILNNYAGNG